MKCGFAEVNEVQNFEAQKGGHKAWRSGGSRRPGAIYMTVLGWYPHMGLSSGYSEEVTHLDHSQWMLR